MHTHTDKNGNLHTFMTLEDKEEFIRTENGEEETLKTCENNLDLPDFFSASLTNGRYYIGTALAPAFLQYKEAIFVANESSFMLGFDMNIMFKIAQEIKGEIRIRKVVRTSANAVYIGAPKPLIKMFKPMPQYATFKQKYKGVYNVEHFGKKL